MPFPRVQRSKKNYRKQILLFVISVLLPSLVLLFFTLRLNRQENELRKKRAEEAKAQKAEEIGRHILVRLEKVEQTVLQELSINSSAIPSIISEYPELVFIGRILDGELRMPWEEFDSRDLFQTNDPTGKLILQAQQEELSQNNFRQALSLYNQALSLTSVSSKKIFIQMQLGRLYSKSGEKEKAIQLYKDILSQPGNITDEYAIPFTLYAADKLSLWSGTEEAVTKRIEELLKEMEWLPASALHFIRDITEQIDDTNQNSSFLDRIQSLTFSVEERLELLTKVQSLKSQVPAWMSRRSPMSQSSGSNTWESYGDVPWIVGIREGLENSEHYLFSFNGEGILASVIEGNHLGETYPGTCRMVETTSTQDLSLGGSLRNFRIQFEETDASAWAKSTLPLPILYWLILFLVVGFTGFGMYLLWRDFNRGMAVAEMKSHFAASVSHELKTPLTAIRMFAEALTMGVKKQPEAQNEYLQTIINESERLSRLLNNVLDFSKIEQGTRTYSFEAIKLEDVVRAAANAISFPMKQKGFSLSFEIEKDDLQINADRDALEQAVLNLLHNAIKYSGESRDIVVKLREKENEARIEVIDNGIGISEEDKNRIFGKYFRVSGIENQRIPGAGLGLAIVSHIAEAHGGKIEVDSRLGEGSTFSLVLPLEAG